MIRLKTAWNRRIKVITLIQNSGGARLTPDVNLLITSENTQLLNRAPGLLLNKVGRKKIDTTPQILTPLESVGRQLVPGPDDYFLTSPD